MDNVRYNKIAKIIGIVIGIALVLSISYAVYKRTTRGQNATTIEAGRLDLRIDNEIDEITMSNAAPMTDKKGMKTTPYQFDVVNDGTISAIYDLYIKIDENTTIPLNKVKYYLIREEGNGRTKVVTTSPLTLENTTNNLNIVEERISIDSKTSNHYKLYLWIDESATQEEVEGKNFFAKVTLKGSQYQKVDVRKVDVSEKSDRTVYAYYDDNNDVVIKGNGRIRANVIDYLKAFDSDEVISNYNDVLDFTGYDYRTNDLSPDFTDDLHTAIMTKILDDMGYHDVYENVNNMDDLINYINKKGLNNDSNFLNEYNERMNIELQRIEKFGSTIDDVVDLVAYIKALKEMGYTDTESITDRNSLRDYLINKSIYNIDDNVCIDNSLCNKFLSAFEDTRNKGYARNTYIPKSITLEEGILNIPEGLYTSNTNITSVNIPSTVISIDDRAFYDCSNLASINFPAGLKNIGVSAFENCGSLNAALMPNTVTNVGNSAFKNCVNLDNINISSSLNTLSDYVFSNCINLKNVSIPDSILDIREYAFERCTSLNNVVIPKYLKTVGNGAFYYCQSLENISLPSTVNSLGYSAFSWCTNLESIHLSDSITELNATFNHCTNLSNINIPKSLVRVGDSTFSGCSSITEIDLPVTTTELGNWAFENCSSLKNITLSASINFDNCKNAFDNCSLEEIELIGNGKLDGLYYNYPWYSNADTVKKVILSDDVTKIGDRVFSSCSNMETIILGENLNYIGDWAFEDCSSLKNIVLPNSLSYVGDKAFHNCSSIEEVSIGSDLTKIRYGTFMNCSSLKKVTLSDSIVSIESDAFEKCEALEGIYYLGDLEDWCNISFVNISSNPVYYGHKLYIQDQLLTDLTIPDSITNIKRYSFVNCKYIESINIPGNVVSIGGMAFSGCSGISEIYIPTSVETIEDGAFSGCSDLKKVTLSGTYDLNAMLGGNNYALNTVFDIGIMEELTLIGNGEINDYTYSDRPLFRQRGLKKITIDGEITKIGDYALSDLSATTVVIGDNVKTIGNYAFYDSSIENVVFGSGLRTIGQYAFSNCSKIKSLNLPTGLVSIGQYAFNRCGRLEGIILPDTLTTIENSAFYQCALKDEIVIPNSVSYVGEDVFRLCWYLENIKIDNTSSYVTEHWNPNWNNYYSENIEYLRN